jgi:uncharacterized membrane protein YccC
MKFRNFFLGLKTGSLAMGAVTFLVGPHIHFIFAIILSGIFYVVFLLLTRALRMDEIQKLFLRVKNRL